MYIITTSLHKSKLSFVLVFGSFFLFPHLLIAQEVLFVVGNTQLSSSDSSLHALMTQELDMNLTIIDDDLATATDANGKDLVYISASVSHATLGNTFANSTAGILLSDKELQDDMGMVATGSGQKGSTTGKTVDIISPEHPLAADLAGTVQVFNSSHVINWGEPNSNAEVIVQKVNASNKLYYSYESGAVMPGLTAPARRVFFFLHDDGAEDLRVRGKALLSAAIQWSAGLSLPYPSSKERILLLVEDTDLSIDGDSAYWHIFYEQMGYNVVLEDEYHYSISDTANIDLIFISSSVNSGNISNTFTNVSIPIMTSEPYLLDDLGMIASNASFGSELSQSLEFTDPQNILSSGLSGVETVYTQNKKVAYGQADTSAHILAQLPGQPNKAASFYYEAGEQMPGLSAPGRRMAFFSYDGVVCPLRKKGQTRV